MSDRLHQAMMLAVRMHREGEALSAGCGTHRAMVAATEAFFLGLDALSLDEAVRLGEFRADLWKNSPGA